MKKYLTPVIYIAGPFRAANSWEIEQNIRRAETLALEVWLCGMAAICPHANTRYYQGAADDRVWLDGDLAILARCDAVLLVPGWERSVGTCAEIAFAHQNSIPVLHSLDEAKDLFKHTLNLMAMTTLEAAHRG